MRVRYTLRAHADLEEIYEYLKRAPTTARSLKSTIERQIGWLGDFPYMAPMTDEPGIRELTLTRYPYKIYQDILRGVRRRSVDPPHTACTAQAAEPAASVSIGANVVARVEL
jgi:plasmid stabilization system protein ParE